MTITSISKNALTTVCLSALSLLAFALPTDGIVNAGQADIAQNGNTMTINQQSNKAVLDWRTFDIATKESVNFKQPSADATALNRVHSDMYSTIDGKLNANGKVVIVNQNGVWFGKNAKVDVNSLVASTADTENDQFMNQDPLILNKPGNPDGGILNEGKITAQDAGLVGIVAPNVMNSGVIKAKFGRVHLAAGDTAVVDFYGDGLMNVAVSEQVTSAVAMNLGEIKAKGGVIGVTASAGKQMVDRLVWVDGEINAPAVGEKSGKIIISSNAGDEPDKSNGASNLIIGGKLNTAGKNADEKGGDITIAGRQMLILNDLEMDTHGEAGDGNITIDLAN